MHSPRTAWRRVIAAVMSGALTPCSTPWAQGVTRGPATSPTLQARVRARLDSLHAASSIYAKQLATGREVEARPDVPVNTVSVIKIPIMVLAYRDAAAGRLNLNERYTLRAEDLRAGTGVLKRFAPGLTLTYRDLIVQMMITSDNSATDVMIERLGLNRVNQLLDSLGYHETRLRTTIGQLSGVHGSPGTPSMPSSPTARYISEGFPTACGKRS